jgi:hypothetical protein
VKQGVAWARVTEHQPVGVDDEPAQVCFLHDALQTGCVSAFRQPETCGIRAEGASVRVAANENLRADRLGRLREQRQQPVRRSGRHDFEETFIA